MHDATNALEDVAVRNWQCGDSDARPLTVVVPEDITAMVEQQAFHAGISPQELVLRTLRAQFAPIPREIVSDIAAWELASEYDAARSGTFRGDL
jgi:hypothetical protein